MFNALEIHQKGGIGRSQEGCTSRGAVVRSLKNSLKQTWNKANKPFPKDHFCCSPLVQHRPWTWHPHLPLCLFLLLISLAETSVKIPAGKQQAWAVFQPSCPPFPRGCGRACACILCAVSAILTQLLPFSLIFEGFWLGMWRVVQFFRGMSASTIFLENSPNLRRAENLWEYLNCWLVWWPLGWCDTGANTAPCRHWSWEVSCLQVVLLNSSAAVWSAQPASRAPLSCCILFGSESCFTLIKT